MKAQRLARLVIACYFLLLPAIAWGQAGSTAQISGTVRDQSGAVLPGADITVTQTETGLTRRAVSDATGSYTLPNLPIGPYRLEVSLSGFRTYVQTGIVLQVNSNPVFNVVLTLGALAETVTVQGESPLVETRTTGIGQVMENQRILQLPLNGRNTADLIQYIGAAVPLPQLNASSRSMQGGVAYAVAGGQSFGVAYVLDGATHNNPYDNLNLPLPFPEALEEFRAETSALSAQNGMHSAAAVNAVTKSGTNAFHGSAFEFYRNHVFNATNSFALKGPDGKRKDDGLTRSQFGGTVGGPIERDKLFFFAAYQGTRVRQVPSDELAFVPTDAMLAGDFTAFASPACNAGRQVTLRGPFVNNGIDPALFSRAALNITGRLPKTDNPCGEVRYQQARNVDERQAVGKIDYQWTTNHSLFGRYIATSYFTAPPFTTSNNILTTRAGGRDNLAQTFTFGDNYVINPTTLNSFRVAVNRTAIHRTHKDFFSAPEMGINLFSYLPSYMLLNVTGGFQLGGGTENEARFTTNTYQISDDVTLVRGSHQLGFGVNLARWDSFSTANVRSPGNLTIDGSATGLGLADFLTGRLTTLQQSAPNFLIMRQTYLGIYGQDAWSITPRLTLNYGVRWDPFFPQQLTNSAVYNFDFERFRQGVKSTVFRNAPAGLYFPGDPGFPTKAGMHKQWLNFAPRVGLGWDPRGDGRMAVRAAYGRAYEFVNAQFHLNTSNAPPWGNEIRINSPVGGLDNPFLGVAGGNPFPTVFNQDTPFTLNGPFLSIPYDLKTTYVHMWNVSVERQIGADWRVSASYVGNRTTGLWLSRQLNNGLPTVTSAVLPSGLVNCVPGAANFQPCMNSILNQRRPFFLQDPVNGRFYGPVDAFDDSGRQHYNGLLLALQRRASSGVTVGANYTLSKCYGSPTGSGGGTTNLGTGYNDPDNPRFDDGNCDSDRRHIFSLSGTAEMPRFSRPALRAMASGWRVSGSFIALSGIPLNLTTGTDRALNGQTATQRVNQVHDNVYGAKTVNNYLNAPAFAQPTLGTLGNYKRNSIYGPGRWGLDVAVARVFRFAGAQSLELRAEAFNLTNRFMLGVSAGNPPNNIGNPDANFSRPTFGQITSAGDPRIMQFAVKYGF